MKWEAPVVSDYGSIADHTFKSCVEFTDNYGWGSHSFGEDSSAGPNWDPGGQGPSDPNCD